MPLRPVTATDCPDCAGTHWRRDFRGDIRPCDCEGLGLSRDWLPVTEHRQVLLVSCGHAAWVDQGMLEDVQALWAQGIWTWVSCQGKPQPARRYVGRYVGLCDAEQVPGALDLLPWAVSVLIRDYFAFIYSEKVFKAELI